MGEWRGTVEGLAMNDFWQGRRVLVTGHTGFKGSWLVIWLHSLKADVTGYALAPPTDPSHFGLTGIEKNIQSILGDVCDIETLKGVMQRCQPEIVIHMAAQSLVRQSYVDPVTTYTTNVMGTVNTLEAVRATPSVRAVVCVTSDKCYENNEEEIPFRETDPMGGFDPYSSSKGAAELIVSSYRNSFFNPAQFESHKVALASARAGNVIGGGDFSQDRLIPDLLSAFSKNQSACVRNPSAVRPWQHVLEPLLGYLMLAEKLHEDGRHYAEGWNFGPENDNVKTVSWVADQMAEQWGPNARWKKETAEGPHEARSLRLDINKSRNKLLWKPRLNLDDTIRLIIDWEKTRQNKGDILKATFDQIRSYEKILTARN